MLFSKNSQQKKTLKSKLWRIVLLILRRWIEVVCMKRSEQSEIRKLISLKWNYSFLHKKWTNIKNLFMICLMDMIYLSNLLTSLNRCEIQTRCFIETSLHSVIIPSLPQVITYRWKKKVWTQPMKSIVILSQYLTFQN